MLFQVYGQNALYQWLGLFLVFGCLIAANEFTRRSKKGALLMLGAIPLVLTVYFIAIHVGVAMDAEWALNNVTYTHMNSWFHYAKLYAALAGCIGFALIKYEMGVGKKKWFVYFPYAILAINILIAVGSDLESAIRAWNTTWISSEGVTLDGGIHNVFNAIAGILNIIGITGWAGIYVSKDKRDMVWPDMIWIYILAYDLWNFTYTYNCLPTHSWYCGVALLLAPTVAAFLWNRGAWLQNRANTLAIWCMFAQVFPLFQDQGKFAVNAVASTTPNLIFSIIALVSNIILVAVIIGRSVKSKKNPYTNEVFTDTADYKKSLDRTTGVLVIK